MFQFLLFLHSLSQFSTQFLKNCGGMLYFPSRLYNPVCIFSTFLSRLDNCACKPYTTAIKYLFSTSVSITCSLFHILSVFVCINSINRLRFHAELFSTHLFYVFENEYGKEVLRKKMALNVLRVFA